MTFTMVHQAPLDVVRCRVQGLKPLALAEGLFKTAASSASLESAAIEAPAPFDELVGSWNAAIPEGASLVMMAQVRTDGGWSRWYELGGARGAAFASPGRQEDEAGYVDVDTLKLKRKAAAFRYRLELSAPGKPIRLRLAAVTVSDGESAEPPPFSKGPWVRELKVRPRSQMEEQEKYKHDICSPTTLAMALDYWGLARPTVETADAVRDSASGAFGVWPFNAAYAASRGLDALVARLDSLEDLQREIAQGRPVPVSVTFGPGELDGAPLKKTKGHFVLVTGFTAKGDVIVLDPAAPTRRSARRVYGRAQFDRIWRVHKRGLAYLLRKPFPRTMTVGVPAADLWEAPLTHKGLANLDHYSQLLYGERVTVLSVKDGWARVLAEEQADYLRAMKWQGYPGWVRVETLSSAAPQRTDCAVRTRQALAHADGEILALSVGTRLMRLGSGTVLLLDGRRAEIDPDALQAPAPDAESARRGIVKTAELFLGTSYYWGGRSGVQDDPSIGVDCSGLASLAYRVQGLDIPRDAHEQLLKSRRVAPARLKPGDLIFLADSPRSKNVNHVMIYTGGDGILESRQTPGRALRTTFAERFGKTLSEIKDGEAVTDLSSSKPRRRAIYFGTYLLE